MGGITGFSSLAEGYLRLDPRFLYLLISYLYSLLFFKIYYSGRGRPDDEFFKQPIGSGGIFFRNEYTKKSVLRFAYLNFNKVNLYESIKVLIY
jgi:hypothetical protein